MNEWIDVEKELPIANEKVLLIIKGYFETKSDRFAQRLSTKIIEGSFNPRIGWDFIGFARGVIVLGWMKRPEDIITGDPEIDCAK